MEKNNLLKVFEITKPHGLKGEMRAKYFCESYVYDNVSEFYVNNEPFVISKINFISKNMCIIRTDGVDSFDGALKFAGVSVYIRKSGVSLPDDTWFIEDIIGLKVADIDTGEDYGTVKDIYQYGSADVYRADGGGRGEFMFNSIPEVIIDTDLTKGIIYIRPLAGTFEDDEN